VDRPSPEIGGRVSLRYANDNGEATELVGFVLSADRDGLCLQTRDSAQTSLSWTQIQAWRPVSVARGRDPLRTPLATLDQLAEAANVHGRAFVIRLSQLLDAQPPQVGNGDGVQVCGEWATVPAEADLIAAAWWAARADARSIQVRTDDSVRITKLLAAGFVEIS
jgi:hypothetical protein